MSHLPQLLSYKERVECLDILLNTVDAQVLLILRDLQLLQRTKSLQADINTGCQAAASYNPFTNVSQQRLKKIQRELLDLEKLTLVVVDENKKFVCNKNEQAFQRLKADIDSFLSSFGFLIELYGFSLMTQPDKLVLGQGLAGEFITVKNQDRNKHCFLIGKTGSGKSEAMQTAIIQDIIAGRGGCLLDPFGSLSRNVAAFVMAYQEMRSSFIELRPKILQFITRLFDGVNDAVKAKIVSTPAYQKLSIFTDLCKENVDTVFPQLNVTIVDVCSKSKSNPFKVNPFSPSTSFNLEQSVQVLLDALAMEMGTSLATTPQATNVLRCLFTLVASKKGNINDLLLLLNTLRYYSGNNKKNSKPLPIAILDSLKISDEPIAQNAADYLEQQLLSFSGNAFNEMINSTRNRLSYLLDSQLCHKMFNTNETTLDLAEIINSQAKIQPFIVFHIPAEEAGASIVSHVIFRTMEKILYQRSDKQKKQLFYLYADEFYKFLGGNAHSASEAADLFTSIRQHGCCLTVAMQNSGQLKKDDPSGYVFSSVVESCHSLIIFSCSGVDAQYFADNQFNEKGQLVELSYSINTGEAKVVGSSNGNTKTDGWSESTGTSASTTESQSKAIGHSVSESFSNASNQSHTESQNSSTGENKGKSENKGTSYHSTNYKDINHSQGNVISASTSHSSGLGSSDTRGSSESKTKGTSQTETNTTGHSNTEGTSKNNGISGSSAQSISTMQSVSDSNSHGVTIKRLGIEEETLFYAQELRKLRPRECFIATSHTINKAITLDSITIKLSAQLQPFLDDYYQQLHFYQYNDRVRLAQQLTVPKPKRFDMPQDRKKPDDSVGGVSGMF
jgi:hypothetical protein